MNRKTNAALGASRLYLSQARGTRFQTQPNNAEIPVR
jgi:hypothetical protein